MSYDLAGNLANDGTTASTFDALNRMTTRGSTTHGYNGDGVLVSQLTAGITTRYTQDLVAPLTQVLQTFTGATRTDYLYGANRLATLTSGVSTWYVADALGSVRRTVSTAGVPQGVISYDPWGTVESGTVPTFGFTGELQQGGLVNLRARWYHAGQGRFGSRDPFAGAGEQPYSQHPYQYAFADPVLLTDPSGQRVAPEDGGGVGPAACRAIGWLWVQYEDGHGRCLPPVPPPNNPAERYASPRTADRDPESGVKLPSRQKQTLGEVLNPPMPMPPRGLPRTRGRTGGLTTQQLCMLLAGLAGGAIATSTGMYPDEPEEASRVVRVRHYSRMVTSIKADMRIKPSLNNSFAIWVEYPLITPYEEKAIQEATESFFRPLNGRRGFVEFNVDQDKWSMVQDPNLPDVPNAKMILLYSDAMGMTYVGVGFPLSDPGVNPAFFDWKGNPL